MDLQELEHKLLENLAQLIEQSKELGCRPLLIGGYAVRAYTSVRKRFTFGELRPIEPYSEGPEGLVVQAPVIPLEDLLILKLMTLRELDTVDTIALLLENPEQTDIAVYRRKVVTAGLTQHINARIEAISELLESGQVKGVCMT